MPPLGLLTWGADVIPTALGHFPTKLNQKDLNHITRQSSCLYAETEQLFQLSLVRRRAHHPIRSEHSKLVMNEMHAGKIDCLQLANKCNHVNICLLLSFAEPAIFGTGIIIHIRKTPREEEGGGAIS